MNSTEPRTELVYLEPRDRAVLDADRSALVAEVQQAVPTAEIRTAEEYAAVADLDRRLSAFIARAEPEYDDVCKSAQRTLEAARRVRSLFLDVPKELKAQCRRLLGAYKDREERERRAEELRRAEEQTTAELARRDREVSTLKQSGQTELAEVVRQQPIEVAPVVLPSAVPAIEGLTFREEWTWEVIGGDNERNRARTLSMLVRPEFCQFVKLDDGGLTAFARRFKDTRKVPGIRFFSRQVPVRRS